MKGFGFGCMRLPAVAQSARCRQCEAFVWPWCGSTGNQSPRRPCCRRSYCRCLSMARTHVQGRTCHGLQQVLFCADSWRQACCLHSLHAFSYVVRRRAASLQARLSGPHALCWVLVLLCKCCGQLGLRVTGCWWRAMHARARNDLLFRLKGCCAAATTGREGDAAACMAARSLLMAG